MESLLDLLLKPVGDPLVLVSAVTLCVALVSGLVARVIEMSEAVSFGETRWSGQTSEGAPLSR